MCRAYCRRPTCPDAVHVLNADGALVLDEIIDPSLVRKGHQTFARMYHEYLDGQLEQRHPATSGRARARRGADTQLGRAVVAAPTRGQ